MKPNFTPSKSIYRERSLRSPVAIIMVLIILALALNQLVLTRRLETFGLLEWGCFGGGYLGLILVELLEGIRYPRGYRIVSRLLLLGVRGILVTAILQTDPTKASTPILSIILYALYFYFGPVPTILTWAIFLYLEYQEVAFMDTTFIEQTVYLSIMVLFASQIKHNDHIHQRNLELMRELENYAANSTSLARQEERNRISRDLHDRLGHYLVAANIQLQKASAYRKINPAESELAERQALGAISDATRELRQTVGSLREIDAPANFRSDLEKLINGVRENGLLILSTIKGSEEGYSGLALMTLLQAVQEGLTNVEKHANANQVLMTLDFGRKKVNLSLQDDGVGFSPQKLDETNRFGLNGLRERVDLARGTMKIESRPEKGTILKITLPKRLVE